MSTTAPGAPRYTPALGFRALTRFYDALVRRTMPEHAFKRALVEQARLAPGQTVLDVGSGTGTLALMIEASEPRARAIGLDGDPEILALARAKAREASARVEFREGFSYELPFEDGSVGRVVSSLVFHHLSPPDKRRTLAEIRRVLEPGGELHVLDWGKAQDPFMRAAFLGVQLLDGFAGTRENVRGELPRLMQEAGLVNVSETRRGRTIFGTLSLYRAEAPPSGAAAPGPRRLEA